MSNYTHTTLLTFRTLLKNRLGDANGVFWIDTELNQYILESLRVWNSLSQFSRDRGIFPTVNGQAFYEVNPILDKAGVKLLEQTLTDQYTLVDVKCALMEDTQTLSPTTWGGTEQFTLQDVQDAIEKARNEFLLKTHCSLSHTTITVPAGGSGRITLDDSLIDIVRASFLSIANGSTYYKLERSDEMNYNTFIPDWNLNPDSPTGYSLFLTPYVSVQLLPIPINNGTLSLIVQSIDSATQPDLTILTPLTGVSLGIPNDFAWAVKYGALAYLFSKEGIANDPLRADYCQKRFEQGIQACLLSSSIQQALLNDVNLIPSSIEELDTYIPDWESSSGQPTSIGVVGDLICLNPVPDAIYSVTLDVVRNIPVPAADSDYIQVGREHISTLLDYCVHLAMLKVGGIEFQNSLPLFQNMLELATEHNSRLNSQSFNFECFKAVSNKQLDQVPLTVSVGNS